MEPDPRLVAALAAALEVARRKMIEANLAWAEGRELPIDQRAEWGTGLAAAILPAFLADPRVADWLTGWLLNCYAVKAGERALSDAAAILGGQP
jgi:hypothetical protein